MSDQNIIDRIELALDQVRPAIRMDGGDVLFVSLKNNILFVRLTGACVGCPFVQLTLSAGIEETVVRLVPEVHSVKFG
ncbi:NifU family protein [bacterium]|jgi:Fe-S cluster biogenesis protein NfuA|nr:NifU family protein [bacterium]MBT3903973.1 NifU family protein [bacterium]MBT4577787.1 NifU family protein [bacterium]MBT5346086.1 NifU family protein [bacterium]MBT6131355.1 NifU family protein [bacterium]